MEKKKILRMRQDNHYGEIQMIFIWNLQKHIHKIEKYFSNNFKIKN